MMDKKARRTLLVYLALFVVLVGIPLEGLPEVSAGICDAAVWAGLYALGAAMAFRFDARRWDAAAALRLIAAVAAAVPVLLSKPWGLIAALSAQVPPGPQALLAALTIAFLAYCANGLAMGFGLLLAVGAATRRLPPGGSIALLRLALFAVVSAAARTVLAAVMLALSSAAPEGAGSFVLVDSFVGALIWGLPLCWLLRCYLEPPGGRARSFLAGRARLGGEGPSLAFWLALLCLVGLAVCVASRYGEALFPGPLLAQLALFAGFAALAFALRAGDGPKLACYAPAAAGMLAAALAFSAALGPFKVFAAALRASAGGPLLLCALGALECAAWAAAVVGVVSLAGAARRPRARLWPTASVLCLAVLAGGAALGLADLWWSQAPAGVGRLGPVPGVDGVALSAESISVAAKWVVGATALRALSGARLFRRPGGAGFAARRLSPSAVESEVDRGDK